MIKFYITQIKTGKMSIENVPEKFREEIGKELGYDSDTEEIH